MKNASPCTGSDCTDFVEGLEAQLAEACEVIRGLLDTIQVLLPLRTRKGSHE